MGGKYPSSLSDDTVYFYFDRLIEEFEEKEKECAMITAARDAFTQYSNPVSVSPVGMETEREEKLNEAQKALRRRGDKLLMRKISTFQRNFVDQNMKEIGDCFFPLEEEIGAYLKDASSERIPKVLSAWNSLREQVERKFPSHTDFSDVLNKIRETFEKDVVASVERKNLSELIEQSSKKNGADILMDAKNELIQTRILPALRQIFQTPTLLRTPSSNARAQIVSTHTKISPESPPIASIATTRCLLRHFSFELVRKSEQPLYSKESVLGLIERLIEQLNREYSQELEYREYERYGSDLMDLYKCFMGQVISDMVLAIPINEKERAQYDKDRQVYNLEIDKMMKPLLNLKSKLVAVDFAEITELIAQSEEAGRTLEGKDVIALVGLTGAGKSTLCQKLLGAKMERKEIQLFKDGTSVFFTSFCFRI